MPDAKTPHLSTRPVEHDWTQYDTDSGSTASPAREYAYTFGRLRPRFCDAGAQHEFEGLGGKIEPSEFDGELVRWFLPRDPGALPSAFFLARALVWPIVDTLGVPQAVVVPASDEEIVELLQNLPSESRDRAPVHSIVRGVLVGFAHGCGVELDGLPQIHMASVLPYASPVGQDPLFTAYQPLLANNGIGDELRAINFILTQSRAFYKIAGQIDERGQSSRTHAHDRLVAMHTRPVATPRARPQIEVVFSFQDGHGAIRRWFQRVAVSGPFPYLTTDTVLPFYQGPTEAIRPQWEETEEISNWSGGPLDVTEAEITSEPEGIPNVEHG